MNELMAQAVAAEEQRAKQVAEDGTAAAAAAQREQALMKSVAETLVMETVTAVLAKLAAEASAGPVRRAVSQLADAPPNAPTG